MKKKLGSFESFFFHRHPDDMKMSYQIGDSIIGTSWKTPTYSTQLLKHSAIRVTSVSLSGKPTHRHYKVSSFIVWSLNKSIAGVIELILVYVQKDNKQKPRLLQLESTFLSFYMGSISNKHKSENQKNTL
ncbi:hypothetical protein BpHYR1_052014 [Brachionus plicatilis]|uniref:Uncharacterized protein n=1 Tax=Brachionus plicatilis TaxID=10195 RepID=A0A3M7PL52_BRAPC|nr:hypothetical protein BpHYR1_052014 [Brachionus plicatilis]